jgi:catechol 2,3-dioxygenase-like lactoylglutathione lyase family enzyme
VESEARADEQRRALFAWDRITVGASPAAPDLEGRSVADLAADRGGTPFDVMADVALADDLGTRFAIAVSDYDEEVSREFVTSPSTLLGLSDAGAHVSQMCGAAFGPHLLGHWVRERRWSSFAGPARRVMRGRAVCSGLRPPRAGRVPPMTGTQAPAADALGSLGLGRIDQVSFVVRDLDASLPTYAALFGPFTVRMAGPSTMSLRGKPVSPTLRLAFAHQGDLEIELVEVVEGESPHAEHLATHGEGIHHVRYRVDDLARARAAMETAGFVVTFEGVTPRARFAYLERPDVLGYTNVELLEPRPPADESTASG